MMQGAFSEGIVIVKHIRREMIQGGIQIDCFSEGIICLKINVILTTEEILYCHIDSI